MVRRNVPARVFLSHTSDMSDYPSERSYTTAAREAILRAGDVPVEMTYFPAIDMPSLAYCRREVEASDLLVAIIGWRYGSIAAEDTSFTEWECRIARDSGIPLVVFLI